MDAAEAFRDLPGLALLESARPGRTGRWSFLSADPLAVLDAPAEGPDPFAEARSLLRRLGGGRPGRPAARPPPRSLPPFTGGLVGYLGYDLGRRFERLPSTAHVDQHLPVLRLALHDWALAWDRRRGEAWLVARPVDGDATRMGRRVARRARTRGRGRARRRTPLRARGHRGTGRGIVPAVDVRLGHDARRLDRGRGGGPRGHRARRGLPGEPHPASRGPLRRRPVAALPAPAHRRPGAVRRVPGHRAVARDRRAARAAVRQPGAVPVRRRGRRACPPTRSRAPGRAAGPARRTATLARELLASGKDQAENVMIVDVLRNDLGRVCEPGSVRVPRLLRLERTAAVQHLVTTVTGQLRAGVGRVRPAGGRVPRRLDHRCPEDPRDGADRGARARPARPVLRGDDVVRAGRADGLVDPHPDVRRGRRAADAPRRRRHHLAQRPGGRSGTRRWPRRGGRCRRSGRSRWSGERRDAVLRVGRRTGAARRRCRTCPSSTVASSWATGSSRPSARAAATSPSWPSTSPGSAVPPGGLDIELPDDVEATIANGIADLLAAEGLGGPDGDASIRITVSRGAWASRGLLPPRGERLTATIVIQAWPVTARADRPPRDRALARRLGRPARSRATRS